VSEAAGRVWVLADDRVGHANQALAVAESLGLPFETRKLRYNALAQLPNGLLGATLAHLTTQARRALAPPWPDLVIAAGRRTAPAARALRRAAPGLRCVQCMWPGAGAADFDLIALPAHDRQRHSATVVRTLGAPHRVTPARLAEAADVWAPRLDSVPHPRIGLLVGGATRRRNFTAEDAKLLAKQAAGIGGAVMMTSSRRTPVAVRDILASSLRPQHRYDWSEGGTDNPYLGYLALADALVVTGDSTGMCTEACATGLPVYIFAPPDMIAAKHRALHQALYAAGLAQPLEAATRDLARPSAAPLDDAASVAIAIRERELL
jgi:uncharacterized protein